MTSKTYRRKRKARIQIALPVEKKQRWVGFAESEEINLTELIETAVEEYIYERTRPRETDIPGPYPF